MKTLKQLMLSSELEYNPNYGIWAESLDPDSEARIGQFIFENGGKLDGFVLIGSLEQILYSRQLWGTKVNLEEWVLYFLWKLENKK